MGEYAYPGVLVETDWLVEHLDDPTVRVIEVDEDTTAYQKGHIRNALSWHWSEDLHDKPVRDFVDQARLYRLLANAGVGPLTVVVLYGGSNNWFAAFAYWLLRYRGFDSVRLLNGGRKKWEREGRILVTGAAKFDPADMAVLGPERPELRALRDDVLARAGQSRFVDVRSPEEYRGELTAPPHLPQEGARVPGHIPGAQNVPWSKTVNEDGAFRSPDELRRLYQAHGITPESSVVAYCRIGERAAHTWFVLHELLGYQDVRNYDGSWTEYGSLVGAPVELGSSAARYKL